MAREALVARGLREVERDELDLSDLASVRAFAERFLASGRNLDILVNNAAIMACPEARVGKDWESQFATNHLGDYVLTNLLWPALVMDGGARVVALSSTGHKLSGIRFDDPQFTTHYDKWLAYGQAKSANSLFAVHLDRLGGPHGVRAFAAHPGGIMTELQRHLPREEMIAAGWMTADGSVNERFKSPAQGAATSTWAATSPMLHGRGGVYCEDCDIAEPTAADSPEARVCGVNASPQEFADQWSRHGGPKATPTMGLGLYAADEVNIPSGIPGRLRLATDADAWLLRGWADQFWAEAGARAYGNDEIGPRIKAGLLFVWEVDDVVVSMAAVTVAQGAVSRVGLVYTPAQNRRRGFASVCVASLTARELAVPGRTCMLYTDLANPTSNSIYQEVGYRRAGEAVELRFDTPTSGRG